VRKPAVTATKDESVPESGAHIPLSIQANYFEPFRRRPTHGLPVCDLQLRSYNIRNLEFMCDFALRAAYYANLPASGPVPLPKKVERWTVPRGNFVHKKSQENFERVTHKRLIQIKDGHPETVEYWLAFLRKHQFHGVGMKANIWGWDEIGVGKQMDIIRMQTLRDVPRPSWSLSGAQKNVGAAQKAQEILGSPEYTALAKDTPASEVEVEVEVQEGAPEPVQEEAQSEPAKADQIKVEEAKTQGTEPESVVASEVKAEEDEVEVKEGNAEAAPTPEKG